MLVDENFVIVQMLYKVYNKIAESCQECVFAVEVDFDSEHELYKQN